MDFKLKLISKAEIKMTGDLKIDMVQQERGWYSKKKKWCWVDWDISSCPASAHNCMCDLGFTSLKTIISAVNKRLLNDLWDPLLTLGFYQEKRREGRGEGEKEERKKREGRRERGRKDLILKFWYVWHQGERRNLFSLAEACK